MEHYPPSFIVCGTEDPLYDDAVRFGLNLKMLGRKCEIIGLKYLGHAFLVLNLPLNQGVSEVDKVHKKIVKKLKEFFYLEKSEEIDEEERRKSYEFKKEEKKNKKGWSFF